MLIVANQRMKMAGEDISAPVFGESGRDLAPRAPKHEADEVCLTKPGINRKITLEEFKAQDRQRPWFVVNGEVYDGTPFLKDHPGGGDSILLVAGEDASEDFFAIHSAEGKHKLVEVSPRDLPAERLLTTLPQHHIGTLVTSLTKDTPTTTQSDGTILERSRWKSVRLCDIKQISHDSYLYRFALPKGDQLLGLPVGQHVFVRLRRQDTGEMVQRAYTPVSQQGTVGFIDFLIKCIFSMSTRSSQLD
jgi:nitrate reductase (NAD(P)H)